LVPGIGKQGGNVEEAITNGVDKEGLGMIVNSSREIIYSSPGSDFAEKAREKCNALRNEINKYRNVRSLA
jgi:orotidine-5'-phosphate decarboxylase